MSLIPNCQICKIPLSPEEFALSRVWHFDCQRCQLCGHDFPNPARIAECLTAGIPVSHITCFDKTKIEEIKNKVIPITREHVSALNNQILILRSMVEPSQADYDLLRTTLMELQECAANVSFVLTLTKDKIRIADSQEYAEKVKTERKAKSADAAAKNEVKAQYAAERENPVLRDRRKAIEGIMKTFGMSLADATAMIDRTKAGGIQ